MSISALQPPPSTLPPPMAGLTLKYVAIGLGTQNYTCNASTATSAPVSTGAIATLYDKTTEVYDLTRFNETKVDLLQDLTCLADHTDSVPASAVLGHHFFSKAGVPTFDLSQGTKSAAYPQGLFFSGKKNGSANAPATACTGRDGGKAVAWLDLVDDGRGVSRGVSQVYRVETAGGSAPTTCKDLKKDVEMDYAALYYFYGR